MVSSEEIKRRFLNYKDGSNRKKRCGCIETKIMTLGSSMWVQDLELMCKKHRLEHKKEFEKQVKNRILIDIAKRKTNNKRRKNKQSSSSD